MRVCLCGSLDAVRRLGVPALAILAGCATAPPDGRPPPFSPDEVVEQVVLEGPEGVEVQLAQSADAALVVLEGVRDDLDGVVLRAKLGGSTAERSYLTELNGRQARLLGRENRSWTLLLEGPIALDVDEDASEALDVERLIDRHVHQRAEGQLAALARFDVGAAKTAAEGRLAETMARVEDACGFVPDIGIAWEGLTEEQLMRYSISGYCDAARSALERACGVPEAKAFLQRAVAGYTCRFGEAPALELEADRLVFTVDFDTPNQDRWARAALDRVPIDEGRTLRAARIEHDTLVCAASGDEGHVVVGPREDERTRGVAYGQDGVLYRQPERRYLPEGWFFEPRYPNPGHNSSFRGYDLRVFSYIGMEGEDACLLKCGEREIPLEKLEGEEKRAFLAEAEWQPIPNPREPYALARDKRGIYYYVDRGATSDTAKDFRLYVGRQGRLRLQRMKDIVSDSEGEIFASARGRLKLFLGKEEAEWLSRGRRTPLQRVAVSENLPLIYGRLGVYLGERLHTPCDDL